MYYSADMEGKLPVLACRIRRLLDEQGLTPTKLAENAGMTPQAVNNYINKDKAISSIYLCALAKALNTTPDYLLGFTDAATPDKPEIRAICDATGLSEKAGESLLRLRKFSAKQDLDDVITYADWDLQAEIWKARAELSTVNAILESEYVKRGGIRGGPIHETLLGSLSNYLINSGHCVSDEAIQDVYSNALFDTERFYGTSLKEIMGENIGAYIEQAYFKTIEKRLQEIKKQSNEESEAQDGKH